MRNTIRNWCTHSVLLKNARTVSPDKHCDDLVATVLHPTLLGNPRTGQSSSVLCPSALQAMLTEASRMAADNPAEAFEYLGRHHREVRQGSLVVARAVYNLRKTG